MAPTAMARPARSAGAPAPAAVPVPSRRRPRDSSWTLPTALTIAALVHLLALLTIRFNAPWITTSDGVTPRLVQFDATEVVPLVAVPDLEFVEPPPVDEERPAPAALPEVTVAVPPPARTTPAGPPASISERIRPPASDPRLWAPPTGFPPPVDAFDAMLDRVAGRLGAWNDSTAAAALAAAKATDWTVTDADGGRWGVSPGQLHLGSITLPLPVAFATPAGRREETLARVRGWSEIEAQAGRTAVRATFDERVKAIRARTDAQRDSTKKAGDATKKTGG